MKKVGSPLLTLLGVALSAMGPSVRPALATPVDVNALGCGAVFTGSGFLSADLDCSASPAPAAVGSWIAPLNGRLELRGFHLTGTANYAVMCGTRCQIKGPGTISTGGLSALIKLPNRNHVRLTDVTVIGGTDGAVRGDHVFLIRSSVTGADVGIVAYLASIIDSTITGCSYSGVHSSGARVVRSAIQGSGQFGVISFFRRASFRDSTVTGNGTDPACGVSLVCGDLLTDDPPRLLGTTTCERSFIRPDGVFPPLDPLPFPGTTWGVCTLD